MAATCRGVSPLSFLLATPPHLVVAITGGVSPSEGVLGCRGVWGLLVLTGEERLGVWLVLLSNDLSETVGRESRISKGPLLYIYIYIYIYTHIYMCVCTN